MMQIVIPLELKLAKTNGTFRSRTRRQQQPIHPKGSLLYFYRSELISAHLTRIQAC